MVVCQQCSNEYKSISSHWSKNSSCSHPSLTQEQYEIVVGLLMGDGTLHRSNKNAKIQAQMTTKEYLKYIDKKFGKFGNGVTLAHTASEKATLNKKSGFQQDAKEENYSNIYRWRSCGHPELNQFRSWYETGNKIWPDDIDLTPTVLKHWFCGDGCWSNTNGNNHIQISMANEIKNREKVDKLFNSSNLPEPSSYAIGKRKDGSKTCTAQFTVSDSEILWDYMGKPVFGFEYKWPQEYQE